MGADNNEKKKRKMQPLPHLKKTKQDIKKEIKKEKKQKGPRDGGSEV